MQVNQAKRMVEYAPHLPPSLGSPNGPVGCSNWRRYLGRRRLGPPQLRLRVPLGRLGHPSLPEGVGSHPVR